MNAPGESTQIIQNNGGSHGMGQEDQWAAAFRPYHFIEKQLQIGHIISEGPDIPPASIRQHAVRESLAPPVKAEGMEAACIEFTDGFDIFFHEFRTSTKNRHSSAMACPPALPTTVSQSNTIPGLKKSVRCITHVPGPHIDTIDNFNNPAGELYAGSFSRFHRNL